MTGGTFRVSRNPIYLGMTLMLLGVGLRGGEALPLAIPVVFAGLIQKRFIESEEEFLTEHFGDAYRAYRSRVRRWL
jgi:protein-S-isoprenylcysteine O-methyltransferase Ste14